MSRIPTFPEVEERVGAVLREQGGLGAVVIDLVSLARVERTFGQAAYQALRAQVEAVMGEVRERVRQEDVLTRDRRASDRFVLFLSARRKPGNAFQSSDLRALAARLEEHVMPRVARLTAPYVRDREGVDLGYGFVLHNPVESLERQMARLVDECLASSELRRRVRERDRKEDLLEAIVNRTVWTAFQPIVSMEHGRQSAIGYEALARGPRGTELEGAGPLFGAAARYGLTDELERAARRQTLVDWEAFGSPGRLFMNTVPATVRDPTFLGRGVLDYLGPRLSPSSVTLEINEGQVIENLTMYREAMHAFLDLGFTFAIDDVGAGYSGLETMATLGASYFKIDMGLVREVHHKRVSQQVIKAIVDMGAGVGATVIAEGIETAEEAEALLDLGIRFGQGYFFGRPMDPKLAAGQAARQTG